MLILLDGTATKICTYASGEPQRRLTSSASSVAIYGEWVQESDAYVPSSFGVRGLGCRLHAKKEKQTKLKRGSCAAFCGDVRTVVQHYCKSKMTLSLALPLNWRKVVEVRLLGPIIIRRDGKKRGGASSQEP
jgi:hypothetical protein